MPRPLKLNQVGTTIMRTRVHFSTEYTGTSYCKGICDSLKTQGKAKINGGYGHSNYKEFGPRCSICDCHILRELCIGKDGYADPNTAPRCPCCNYLMRQGGINNTQSRLDSFARY